MLLSATKRTKRNFYAALREYNEKIYDYFYYFEAEKLAYAFSHNTWIEGETMCFEHCEEDGICCVDITKIDSVLLLDNKYYKTTFEQKLIRGIGFKSGFFRHMFFAPTNGYQFALLCFSKNGDLVYKNSEYKNCSSCEKINSSVNETHTNSLVGIINIPNGVLFDIKNIIKPTTLTVCNMAGATLLTKQIVNNQQFALNLDKGYYFDQIDNKTAKFIVK